MKKKGVSWLLILSLVLSLFISMPVVVHADGPVCEYDSVAFESFEQARTVAINSGGSVKLLANIDSPSVFELDGEELIIDLNGFDFNIVVGAFYGLYVHSHGKLIIIDTSVGQDGTFNVTAPGYGVLIENGEATVTNVTATFEDGIGANVSNGKLTVSGKITANYPIQVNNVKKDLSEYDTTQLVSNYNSYSDGDSVVWLYAPTSLIDLATVSSDGLGYTFSGGLLTITGVGPFEITNSAPTTNRVVVNTASNVISKIITRDLNIDSTASGKSAFALSNNSKVNMTLVGTNDFISASLHAGLEVPEGTEITIDGTVSDKLSVSGGLYAAGLGGGDLLNAGSITIKGGTINAIGYIEGPNGSGAGIGGGRSGNGGTIVIEGGVINSTGGYRAAGIGGGAGGTSGNITIKDGYITAIGTTYGSGIGGGTFRPADTITIEGGTIVATGVGGGAGIGGGYINADLSATHQGGTINISGGSITAISEEMGSGIGGGCLSSIYYLLPTNVNISGGLISAQSYSGAGIGSNEGEITISGGTIFAKSKYYGAGIGGGSGRTGGIINILAGSIVSEGSESGAGIGGGKPLPNFHKYGGDINISGGSIKATGGENASGIGGGEACGAGNITITGGEIIANGNGGAAIGIGIGGNGGVITISKAKITVFNSEDYGQFAICAGDGKIKIGFVSQDDGPDYDSISNRAMVTIDSAILDPLQIEFGTCSIFGVGAGEMAGFYIEGIKQIPTYTIQTIENYNFVELAKGYGDDVVQTKSFTIENSGTETLNNLSVSISGENANAFVLSEPLRSTLPQNGDKTTFTLKPVLALEVGTYLATVTLTANNMENATFEIKQEVTNILPTGPVLTTDWVDKAVEYDHDYPFTISVSDSVAEGPTVLWHYVNESGPYKGPSYPNLPFVQSMSLYPLKDNLNPGVNTLTYYAIDAAGNRSKDLVITFILPYDQATLTNITASQMTLAPNFSNEVKTYSASVANFITTTHITAIANNEGAIIKINGQSGAGKEVSLAVGANTIIVELLSNDSEVIDTYTLTITRGPAPSTGGGGSGGGGTETGSGSGGTETESGSGSGGTSAPSTQPVVEVIEEEIPPLGSIKYLAPYMRGYIDGTFRQEKSVTRAEMAAILARIMELDLKTSIEKNYIDVTVDNHWAYAYIQAVSSLGFFNGYSDGTFGPDEPITRAEVAEVFSKYWAYSGAKIDLKENPFNDITESWAKESILKAYSTGLMNGFPGGSFKPNDFTLREQIVVIVNKILGRTPLKMGSSSYPDVEQTHWAFGDIAAASNTQE